MQVFLISSIAEYTAIELVLILVLYILAYHSRNYLIAQLSTMQGRI